MPNKSTPFTIKEISGDRFPNLELAQRSASTFVAVDLAGLLRNMIESGVLEVRDHRIVPKG